MGAFSSIQRAHRMARALFAVLAASMRFIFSTKGRVSTVSVGLKVVTERSMTAEKLKIEDTSDCDTCMERDRQLREDLRTVKLHSLGSAYCPECGREFAVMARAEDVDVPGWEG